MLCRLALSKLSLPTPYFKQRYESFLVRFTTSNSHTALNTSFNGQVFFTHVNISRYKHSFYPIHFAYYHRPEGITAVLCNPTSRTFGRSLRWVGPVSIERDDFLRRYHYQRQGRLCGKPRPRIVDPITRNDLITST